jgi:hypothetical protein
MARKTLKKSSLKNNRMYIILVIGIFLLLALSVAVQIGNYDLRMQAKTKGPRLSPLDYTTKITNKYFSLARGQKMTYEAQTSDGLERVEIQITGQTKKVMGIQTLVYHDTVTVDGVLVEDTYDYLAQNKTTGDVWYFGESVDNYNNGVLVNHSGSWLAGVNDAQPGIWVKASPQVSESYQQEYLAGEAEDMVTVISTDETVTIGMGTYTNCLKTYDWTPLNPASRENKYYCPELATMVLAVDISDNEREELVKIENDRPGATGKGTSMDIGDEQNTTDDTEVSTSGSGMLDVLKNMFSQRKNY